MPEKHQQQQDDLHDVWSTIRHIQNDFHLLSNNMTELGTKIDTMTTQMDRIISDRKMPWGTVFGAIAILCSILTAGGGAVLAPLYLSDSMYSEKLQQHIELDGHPKAMVQYAQVEKDIERIDALLVKKAEKISLLDESLQREMRLLNGEIEAKLTALDMALQREMNMLLDVNSTTIQNHNLQLDRIMSDIKDIEAEISELAEDDDVEKIRDDIKKLIEKIAKLEK